MTEALQAEVVVVGGGPAGLAAAVSAAEAGADTLLIDEAQAPGGQIWRTGLKGPPPVAVEWIDRWPDWPALGLALYGPPGSGKSHLASVFRERSGARALEPSNLREQEPPELLGEAAACVIDPLDDEALASPAVERRLFHLVNMLAERRGALLLVGCEPPARWRVALPDLRSRLQSLMHYALAPLGDADKAALLTRRARRNGYTLDEAVVAYWLIERKRRRNAENRLSITPIVCPCASVTSAR